MVPQPGRTGRTFMKATSKIAAGIVAVAAMTVALALPAAAHKAVGEPAITCTQVSVQLEDFPQSESTITFHIKVNGGPESTKTTQFTGPSGTATVSISDLTTSTGTLNIEAFASWTIDNGGKSDTANLTTVCHETPQETPTTPIEVGGVTADRPEAPPATAAEAATAVTTEPRFTG
jgi:hypothetical protein